MMHPQIPAKATQLHEQARAAGSQGDYSTAITLLQEAHALAPTWPYPVYDLAFTFLLSGDSEQALKYYEETVQLAPDGFFTALTAVWTLEREKSGELPQGLYAAWVQVEWMQPEQQAEMVQKITGQIPSFTPGWYKLTGFLGDQHQRLEILEKGLQMDCDNETYGMMLLNAVLAMDQTGGKAGACARLQEFRAGTRVTASCKALAEKVADQMQCKSSGV